MLARVLLAVEKGPLGRKLRTAVSLGDVLVESLRGGEGLWARLSRESADLIMVSRSLIPEPAAETLGALRQLPESPEVVVVTRHEDPDERAHLLAAGCSTVINAALPADALREVIAAVLAKRAEIVGRSIAVREIDEPRLADFVSVSPAMQAFLSVVERVVSGNSSLLILGETGVGKERLARAIHAEGPRSVGPFVAVNCGALAESLLESELFGHEEGAFTGATRSRRGCFELAHGGTIFLDEIGEMPAHLQVKLLRVLQDRRVQRVGGERAFPVDVRIMAASNRDLATEAVSGAFRKDLYYRLGVVTLTMPPLRERREDIPVLADSYVKYLRPRVGVNVGGVSVEAVEAMESYSWPGNVRELVNVIERAMLLCSGEEITPADLPQSIAHHPAAAASAAEPGTGPAGAQAVPLPAGWLARPWREVRAEALRDLERRYLEGVLSATAGRVGLAARRAGMEPRSLFEKMRRHRLRKESFRAEG